jgi:septal ring factor EnvC (AmiA/AmiB activator)
MRRGIWIGAAILVAVAAAVPLWLALDDEGGSARRPAALAAQTDCSSARDAEACAALLRQLQAVDAGYSKLETQLAATASDIAALQTAAGAGRDAPDALLKVGEDIVAVENHMDAVRAEMAKWTDMLNSVGDDAQLANVEMQNIVQKQQQMLQMLSNISKNLHDTIRAVVNNLKG